MFTAIQKDLIIKGKAINLLEKIKKMTFNRTHNSKLVDQKRKDWYKNALKSRTSFEKNTKCSKSSISKG